MFDGRRWARVYDEPETDKTPIKVQFSFITVCQFITGPTNLVLVFCGSLPRYLPLVPRNILSIPDTTKVVAHLTNFIFFFFSQIKPLCQFNTAAKFGLVWGPEKAGKKSKAGPPDNFTVANGPTAFGFRPETPNLGAPCPP